MLLPVEVIADVGNVRVEVGETALRESEVRNTSANAGAGTGIEHVLADWSHCTVVTFSVPFKRPSDCNIGPNDCGRETVMSGKWRRRGMGQCAYLPSPSEVVYGCYRVGQKVPVKDGER